MSQKGFSTILIILVMGVVALVVIGSYLLGAQKSLSKQEAIITPALDPNLPPLLIKSLPINFEDLVFTKEKLQFGIIFSDYGFFIPASSASPDKKNPQPTFLVPLGTKVHSIVDGVVLGIPKLYSGDYSVMVGTEDKNSPWRYETEHVINPLVKVGDKVKAGQVIAEVSDYDKQNGGLGIVEMGLLKGGNPPKHYCPFAYLDPSIKDEIFKKLLNFYKSWEEYRGDQTLYPENYTVPGCLTQDLIEG